MSTYPVYYGRQLITDGETVCCCTCEKNWDDETRAVYHTVNNLMIIGRIGEGAGFEPPDSMCGVKVRLIGGANIYQKGDKFEKLFSESVQIKNAPGAVLVPLANNKDAECVYAKPTPDSEYLTLTAHSTERLVLGKIPLLTAGFSGTLLKEVFFSEDSPKEIPGSAFEECTSLHNVHINKGTERIGSYAFSGCTALEQLNLPETLRHISEAAFMSSGISAVTLPPKVQYIGDRAFARCIRLKTVIIPPSVRIIAKSAFNHSPNMQIAAFSGTAAHAFALSHNIPFVPIEELMMCSGI